MEENICFAFCIVNTQTVQRLEALLHIWAEEMCLQLTTKQLSSPIEEKAGEYAMLLVDDGDLNGETLSQLQRLRERDLAIGLVLLTADERIAIDSYQCHPNAVIPEPLSYAGLKAAMNRCFACWSKGLQWLDLPLQHRRLRIPLYHLLYAEAAGRNTILYCIGEQVQVNCSLSALEARLPNPPFVRCQKSFVVHLAAVRRIESGRLIMTDDRQISVTRTRLRQVQEEFSAYQSVRSPGEGTE